MTTVQASISLPSANRTTHRPARIEGDHLAREDHLGFEPSRLLDCALRELHAEEALREAEVVLDPRALTGLTTGSVSLDDDGAESLRRAVRPRPPTRRGLHRRCTGRTSGFSALVRRSSARARSRVDGARSGSRSGMRTSGRSVAAAGRRSWIFRASSSRSEIEPPIRDVVAPEECLDLVASRRPAMPDHADPAVIRVGTLHTGEQVVEDGIQLVLRPVPWLHQVVVEVDVVDRPDRDIGVGVHGVSDTRFTSRALRRAGRAARLRSSTASVDRRR